MADDHVAVRIVMEEAPSKADLDTVEQGLIDHAADAGVAARDHRPLTLFARAESGRVVGGLVGDTVWGWLQVKQLWVASSHRRRGHGTSLLEAAEREAKRRGCHHVLLDTFDFQAPAFYARLGYAVFGSLADFPSGNVRFFMSKAL
jgi:GNAT superfamily N-acetyltransferase